MRTHAISVQAILLQGWLLEYGKGCKRKEGQKPHIADRITLTCAEVFLEAIWIPFDSLSCTIFLVLVLKNQPSKIIIQKSALIKQ